MNHPLTGRSQHGLEILVCEKEKEVECVIIRQSSQQNQKTFSVLEGLILSHGVGLERWGWGRIAGTSKRPALVSGIQHALKLHFSHLLCRPVTLQGPV